VTLTSAQVQTMVTEVMSWPRQINKWNMKDLWWIFLMVMSGGHFYNYVTKVTLVSLTFDLVNIKSIGAMFSQRPIGMWNIKGRWYLILKIISGDRLFYQQPECYKSDPCDLDLNPSEHKINTGDFLAKIKQKWTRVPHVGALYARMMSRR